MLTKNVTFDHKPDKVVVEELDGVRRVLLRDNIKKDTSEDAAGYVADEVIFTLGREVAAKEVKASFADWWTFGAENDSDAPGVTVEERLSALEDAMAAMIFGEV